MRLKRFFFLKDTIFFYLKQEARSYLEFATLIKEKAAFCKLGDFYVPVLALVFTMGINDPQLREKFLEIENCTLEQALAIAQKKRSSSLRRQLVFKLWALFSLYKSLHNHRPIQLSCRK